MTLADWLAHCERLHPKTIELTLDRVATVKARLAIAFAAPMPITFSMTSMPITQSVKSRSA